MRSTLDLRPRRYDHPDAAALTDAAQAYYRKIYGGPDRSPIEPDEFSPPSGGFVVGYLEEVPVAMGGWRLLTDPPPVPARQAAEIKRMFVSPDVRRHGLATTLLTRLETAAATAGVDLLVLETGTPQAEAVAFYSRRGYAHVPPFGYYACAPGSIHLGKRLVGSI